MPMPRRYARAKASRRFSGRSSFSAYSRAKPSVYYRSNARDARAIAQPVRRFGGMFRAGPFAPGMRCTHQYVENLSLSANALAGLVGTEQAFRLNSLFDPNFTGAGHQPQGFDQCAAIWGRYKVYAVKWEIQAVPNQDNLILISTVSASTDSTGITGGAIDGVIEQPRSSYRLLSGEGNQAAAWATFMRIQAIEGMTAKEFNANTTDYGAAATGNPASVTFLRLACANTAGGTTGAINVIIRFTYYAEWSVRNTLATS